MLSNKSAKLAIRGIICRELGVTEYDISDEAFSAIIELALEYSYATMRETGSHADA